MISTTEFTDTLEADVEAAVEQATSQFDSASELAQTRSLFRELLYSAVSDIVYANDWFARSHYGIDTYGTVIREATACSNVDASDVDIASAGDQPAPGEVLETLARELYEQAVTARAIETADWPTDTDGGATSPPASA